MVTGGQLFPGDLHLASPGAELEVAVPPGRYEIYVDGHYTGRAFVAPDDPSRVEGIPLPAC